jgi:hypothetical protein
MYSMIYYNGLILLHIYDVRNVPSMMQNIIVQKYIVTEEAVFTGSI